MKQLRAAAMVTFGAIVVVIVAAAVLAPFLPYLFAGLVLIGVLTLAVRR